MPMMMKLLFNSFNVAVAVDGEAEVAFIFFNVAAVDADFIFDSFNSVNSAAFFFVFF